MSRKRYIAAVTAVFAGAVLVFGGCGQIAVQPTPGQTEEAAGKQDAGQPENTEGETEDTEASEVTFKDIVEANSADAAFSRHKNYFSETFIAQDGLDQNIKAYGMYGFTCYAEPGLKFYDRDYYDETTSDNHFRDNALLEETGSFYSWDENGKKIYSKAWYAMSDEERAEKIIVLGNNPDRDIIENDEECGEHTVSSKDNGDGTLTVMTNAPIDRNGVDFSEVPDEWRGKDAEYHYIVDRNTLEIKEIDVYILTDDGPADYLTQIVTYDVEKPKGIAEMQEHADYMDSGNYENPRKITVIYDPGSEKEEIFETTADKSFKVTVWVRDGYGKYGDSEGKSQDIIPDDNGNVVIYSLPEVST